jgi:hypothetical protein
MSPRLRSRTIELVAGAISAMLALAAVYGIALMVAHLSERPSLDEVRAEREGASRWPTVEGTLERLTVSGSRAGRGQGRVYGAEASYRYEAGGKRYDGTRIGFDWHVSHSSELEDFRSRVSAFAPSVDLGLFLDSPACAQLGAYESCSYSYTPEAPLQVHYDPQDPGSSVLEPRDLVPASALDYWVEPLAWLAVLMALVAAGALSTWLMLRSSSLPPAPVLSARASACWALTLGLVFLAIPLEYYLANLGWRGALDDSGRRLAWAVAVALMLPLALLGLWLFWRGLRGMRRAPQEAVDESAEKPT